MGIQTNALCGLAATLGWVVVAACSAGTVGGGNDATVIDGDDGFVPGDDGLAPSDDGSVPSDDGSVTDNGGDPSCPTGLSTCGGSCVDTLFDPSHCGSCGRSCGDAGVLCIAGDCGISCAAQAGASGQLYYVSPTGNDQTNSGLSETDAFASIAHAASRARAGDTVLVAPGNYGTEEVTFPSNGEAGKPIVVKGHGGRPELQGNGQTAFLLQGNQYIQIEGFNTHGYRYSVQASKSHHCWIRDIRGLGRGGDIAFTDGVNYSWVDSCYVEDSYWNSIFIYGDPYYNLEPSAFNAITNSAVVRGGHSSIDVHTGCPDNYVVGNVMRERGVDSSGNEGACGLYLHNHHIDRLRAIGNGVTEVYWGLELAGSTGSLVAENLLLNFVKADVDFMNLADEGYPENHCRQNGFQDNIILDENSSSGDRSTMRLAGAKENTLARNYVDGRPKGVPDYQSLTSDNVVASDNVIADPLKGRETINVGSGTYALSYSTALWPSGTKVRLTNASNQTTEKTIGPTGADFGALPGGTYDVELVAPGERPTPRHLRVASIPAVAGGAVVVWADLSSNETGFVVERKISGESEFAGVAELGPDSTHWIDREIGRRKAFYRVRATWGAERSEPSNADEIVRYGYWLTDRAALCVDGLSAFAQVEEGALKTLIVEKARFVKVREDATIGLSAMELLENPSIGIAASAPGAPTLLLAATVPVTATLRWRGDSIRGLVESTGQYTLKLVTSGRTVSRATFNSEPLNLVCNRAGDWCLMTLTGSGYLEIELAPR